MGRNGTLRMTRQRRAVLEAVRMGDHPSAADVYLATRQRMPRISLGTVYRNLELLVDHGMIQKLDQAGDPKHFDGTTDEHYHIRCTQCGALDDLPVDPFRDIIQQAVARVSEYQVTGHRFEVLGLCRRCRQDQS